MVLVMYRIVLIDENDIPFDGGGWVTMCGLYDSTIFSGGPHTYWTIFMISSYASDNYRSIFVPRQHYLYDGH